MFLRLRDVMAWTGKSFDFRDILARGNLRFFIKADRKNGFSGPHFGLYGSKLSNFSEYVDEIFLDEDDLCDIIEKKYGENIPANVVRRWLKMSPVQFIDFMNDGGGPVCSLEEAYREHDPFYGPYFKTRYLADEYFSVHVLDWLDWQKARASAGKAIGEAASGLSDVAASNAGRDAALAAKGEELEQARAELAALREENAALKAELEEARAALEKARQGQTGQAKGTTVNAQKWKDSVQAACELLVSIMRGTKDNWRSDDFTEELCKRCRDYHTDVARIAWRTLPDDLKHGPGRPAEKPGNPEHTETIDDLPF